MKIFVLLGFLGLCSVGLAQQVQVPSTPYTRTVLRSQDAASARSSLGLGANDFVQFLNPTNQLAGTVNGQVIPVWQRKGSILGPTLARDTSGGAPAGYSWQQEANVVWEGNSRLYATTNKVFKLWADLGYNPSDVYYYESLDGVNFTNYAGNPCLTNVRCASIFSLGSTNYFYAQNATSKQLDFYRADHDTNFVLVAAGVLSTNGGAWNVAELDNSCVFSNRNGGFLMLCEGNSGGNYLTGLATSSGNLASWSWYGTKAILTNSVGGTVGGPWELTVGTNYWVWTHTSQTPAAGNLILPTDICRWRSADGTNWTRDPAEPALTFARGTADEGLSGSGSLGQVADPCLVPVGNQVYLYYTGIANGNPPFTGAKLKLAIANFNVTNLTATAEGAYSYGDLAAAGYNADISTMIGLHTVGVTNSDSSVLKVGGTMILGTDWYAPTPNQMMSTTHQYGLVLGGWTPELLT